MTHDPTALEVELLPCPLCAGKAVLNQRRLDERNGYNTIYTINCLKCGCQVTGRTKQDKNGWAHDPKQVGRSETIALWNTRTALSQARDAALDSEE